MCVESSRMIPQSHAMLAFPYSRLSFVCPSLALSLLGIGGCKAGVGIRAEDGEDWEREMMRKAAAEGEDIQTHRVGGSTEEGKRGIAQVNERANEWR